MVCVRRGDYKCINIGDPWNKDARVASRNNDHFMSHAGSLEQLGER
jgi:hypothetical protein